MTVTPPENEPTDKGQGEVTEEVKIHPAHQEILDKLPESLHSQIIPTLKKWDEGVQKKINDLHSTYDPYKNFIENNVDPEYLEQATVLLESFNENPEEVIAAAVKHYDLDWAQRAELEKQLKEAIVPNPDPDDDDEYYDPEKDPAFLSVKETADKTAKELAEIKAAQQEAREQQEYEDLMNSLHEEHGEFDDTIVTALLASGLDGEKAVTRYNEIVNQAAANVKKENEPPVPPVVLGGNGSSGSGVPTDPISFGKKTPSEMTAIVAELLSKADKT